MSSKEQPSDHSIMGDGDAVHSLCEYHILEMIPTLACSGRRVSPAAPTNPSSGTAAVCTGDECLGNQQTSTQPDHCAAGAGSTGSGAS